MKQKNTGLIIKANLEMHYAQIPNKLLRDARLGLKSKGLLSILLSLPSDWAVYKTQLQQFSTDGRDATISAFNELIKFGYIVSVKKINNKGQFSGYEYIVYNEPASPFPENPKTVNPNTDNTALQIKKVQKKEITNKDTSNILVRKINLEKGLYTYFNTNSGEWLFESLTPKKKSLLTPDELLCYQKEENLFEQYLKTKYVKYEKL